MFEDFGILIFLFGLDLHLLEPFFEGEDVGFFEGDLSGSYFFVFVEEIDLLLDGGQFGSDVGGDERFCLADVDDFEELFLVRENAGGWAEQVPFLEPC